MLLRGVAGSLALAIKQRGAIPLLSTSSSSATSSLGAALQQQQQQQQVSAVALQQHRALSHAGEGRYSKVRETR